MTLRCSITDLEHLRGRPFLEAVALRVSTAHGCTVQDMIAPTRGCKPIVVARFEAWFHIRQTGRFSMARIGEHFGGRGHATVVRGLRRFTQTLQTKEAA